MVTTKHLSILCALVWLLATACLPAVTERGLYLKDGTFYPGNPKLHYPIFKDKYFSIGDSLKVAYEDVQAYQNKKGHYLRIPKLKGDLDFVYRITEGKITVVETIQSKKFAFNPQSQGYENQQKRTRYFTTDGENYLEMTYSNLKPVVSENPTSKKYLNVCLTSRLVPWVSLAATIGVITVVVSANLDFGEEFSDGEIGLMGGSLGFTTLTFYHAMYTPHYLLLAVKAYNK